MYQQGNVKSSTVAGLLGIFLGAVGAHNWYLGEKGKGIAHVCLVAMGGLLFIIASAILPATLSYSALVRAAVIISILTPLSSAIIGASGLWGLIEGIQILSQGDAGLARKGYAVAEPMSQYGPQQMPGQGYGGYPNQPYYGQPMNQPMGQPMPGQPYYGQPMPGQPMNNQQSGSNTTPDSEQINNTMGGN